MDSPSDSQEATSTSPAVTTRRFRRGHSFHWIPLALAVLWLIGSVIAGVNLMLHDPIEDSALDVSTPSLSASSGQVSYGGDAYTGIQNAAANTESAVVDGVNELGTFELALQQAMDDQESRRSQSMQFELRNGLGFLIIGIGVLNFTVALTRSRMFD